jgi:hypothetical protein
MFLVGPSIRTKAKIIRPTYVPSLDKNNAFILFVVKYSNTGINAPSLMKLVPIAEKQKYRNFYYETIINQSINQSTGSKS